MQAVLTLDLPQLKAARAGGIEPQWVLLALDRVSASDLPLPDKRQRTAWLFRDAAGLSKAFGRTTDGHELKALAGWLPREDWRPVVNAFKDKGWLNFLFDDLCKAAPNLHKNDVLGVLSRVLGRSCAQKG